MCTHISKTLLTLGLGAALQQPVVAQVAAGLGGSRLDAVQVTATRFGEQVQEVPLSISVITNEELRARGASDLRSALALLGGINVAPGGDAGPAGAVPGLLGLREADDFLLLIDGIPAGGAFIPPFEIVSLNNVERIEVLRGAAPVYYGTTAFAGTVNVIHYAAGKADPRLALSYGSRGSESIAGATVLSDGAVRQSVSGELDRDRFADARSGVKKALASYRGVTEIVGGQARADLNLILLRQRPNSPATVDDSGKIATDLPRDFNQNPGDSRLDTNRYQLVLGYDKRIGLGQWGSTVSLTRSKIESLRGFLMDGYRDQTGDNATGAVQSRRLTDVFLDTRLTSRPASWLDITCGINELYGRATQVNRTFTYAVPLNGAPAPDSTTATTGDVSSMRDTRSFFGAYVQSRLRLSETASLLGGFRWNATSESRLFADARGDLHQTHHRRRSSGSLGAQMQVWHDAEGDLDDVNVHLSVGNTFQPPQINFGADAGTQPLLKAETQRSIEFGIKADGLDGRFDVDLVGFFVDFANQATASQSGGLPSLAAAGRERFKGLEIEVSYRPAPGWSVAAHSSYNDARYRDFSTVVGGQPMQLAGNSLPLAPRRLAGAGVVYAPVHGWHASVTHSFVDRRYLNPLNTASVGAYSITDVSLGYSFERYSAGLAVTNLRNRRDPVLASELGEGQFYLLPPRRLLFTLSASVQ